MAKERTHYQIRLVERFAGRRIVTHRQLAHAKSTESRDKTLDIFQADSDRSALQRAREYIARSERRKGPLPADFLGVVVAKYETDPSKPGLIRRIKGQSMPEVTNRRTRTRGTTAWLYFVDIFGNAYHVDAKRHNLTGQVH